MHEKQKRNGASSLVQGLIPNPVEAGSKGGAHHCWEHDHCSTGFGITWAIAAQDCGMLLAVGMPAMAPAQVARPARASYHA